jgi:hypothetical protein
MRLLWNDDGTFKTNKTQLEELLYQAFKCKDMAEYQKYRDEVLGLNADN